MTVAVGFIGLGVMGRPMARNLLAAGYRLSVAARSPEPVLRLAELGATARATPAEVARNSAIVLTSLPDAAAVRSVILEGIVAAGALRPGSIVIDTSTIAPDAARELATAVGRAGGTFLDAPVSGGEVGAIEGSLSIMVGGPPEALQAAMPVLRAIGGRVVHMGPVGAGQAAKACNQLVVMSNLEAVAEALVLAQAWGVDPALVREALLGGLAASRVLELAGQRMLDRSFEPGGRVQAHLKDIEIIREVASRTGVALPGWEQAASHVERLVAAGKGDLDHSAIVTVVQEDSHDAAGPSS